MLIAVGLGSVAFVGLATYLLSGKPTTPRFSALRLEALSGQEHNQEGKTFTEWLSELHTWSYGVSPYGRKMHGSAFTRTLESAQDAWLRGTSPSDFGKHFPDVQW